jgi:hypothetical protein
VIGSPTTNNCSAGIYRLNLRYWGSVRLHNLTLLIRTDLLP